VTNAIDLRPFKGIVVDGRYRLDEFLDQGSFGGVFRASQIAYGVEFRQVAIKIAKRPMTDREARRVFGDALVMARMSDAAPDTTLRQHFVAVHDASRFPESGPLGGHPYVVMEFVEAGSLAGLLRRGPFPLKRAIEYFDQILRAVAFMHDPSSGAPVTHRDLKPANILVSRRAGVPDLLKVSDFGLAIEVDRLLGWVESGGDLSYLAPESFSHNVCSPQSDVYMLGLIFYEMIAGRSPFAEVGAHLRGGDEENHDEIRRLHLSARQLERFPMLASNVELKRVPALAQTIRLALQLDRSQRPYTNAVALLAAWNAARRGEGPIGDRPESAWEAVRRLSTQAEQCFGVGDITKGEEYLREALAINGNRTRVPDTMLVGHPYVLMVQRLIDRSRSPGEAHDAARLLEEACTLAYEAYRRRKTQSTCLAVAKYWEAIGSPTAAGFMEEALLYAKGD
jgi:serine/threonine protein kinase